MDAEKYDVIIIGAGLAGLIAGAKLSKEGKNVLMIEQHNIPGGCATTFKRGDWTIEAGLHEMDGWDEFDPKKEIFEDLGIFGGVEFIKLPEFYRFMSRKIDIVIPLDHKQAAAVLIRQFPQEEKGINKFFKVILGLRKEIIRLPLDGWKCFLMIGICPFLYPNLIRYNNADLGGFLDSIIKDEELKFILLANLGYYHDNPYTMSLEYYSGAQGSYFSGGAYYIRGGSQKLSDYLARVIEKNRGLIILGHLVTKIITKDNKAAAVEYRETFKQDAELKQAGADIIIANAAIPNVVNQLLTGSKKTAVLEQKVKNLEIACSITTLYLGFKRPVKELGNKYFSTFVQDESLSRISDLGRDKTKDYANTGFVFVDYSQIDSRLAPRDKSVGVICVSDYLQNWESLSQRDYRRKKEEVAKILIERLEKTIPGIKNAVEYYELATPLTIKRWTLNPEGTAYGFAQIPSQAGLNRIAIKSPVKQLYFSSAWTRPGGGFSGAILSGYWCAKKILGK
ncbi:MAG: NAD(P)/FAD-dependent oxidoreductase [Candidatus Omnitrophota bacterium]